MELKEAKKILTALKNDMELCVSGWHSRLSREEIEALEKLIPKKPTPLVNIYPPNQHECPVCGCGLRVNEKWKDKYCCNCGLFLDWSEIK